MKQEILDADIRNVKNWNACGFIDNDIILVDELKTDLITTEARRMNYILLGLCLRGEANYTIDTVEQKVLPGDIIILTDRHVIDKFHASSNLDARCIAISKSYFYEVMRDMSDLSSLLLFSKCNPIVSLTADEITVFLDYFQFIKRKVNEEQNPFRKRLVSGLLLAMFYDLSNVIKRLERPEKHRQSRAEIIFTQFIKLVEQNYLTERRVSWYAQQICITPKYLSESVKQISKRSPNDWIDNYVVLEIRLQLKNSNKSIKEIAESLHFPNQSFLGKYFKEHVGVSPSAYRRS